MKGSIKMKKQILHEKHEFENVRALVEWAAETYGDNIAISYRTNPHKDETRVAVSFTELRDKIRGLATEMLAMGCAGKHVSLIGKLSYEWALTYYAAMSIGAILVPLDKDWNAVDLTDTISKADVSFIFCDESIADKIAVVTETVKLEADPVYLGAKSEKRTVEALTSAGVEKFAESSDAYFNAEIDKNTLALLVFTSGTTGKGKGVMLSQNALLSDMSYVIPYIDVGQKTIAVLPPHHTYGSTVMFIGHMQIGCEMYISYGLRYIQKELKEEKPEHLILVPLYLETFYRKINAKVKETGKAEILEKTIKVSNAMRKVGVDLRKKLFSSVADVFGGKLKMIISGGAPINQEIISFYDSIGISTLNGYGITECAPIVAVNRSRNIVPGSVGNVLDIDTVRIDEPNEDGEGEICVKGSNVMLGYYKDEAATAEAFDDDGYFRTGDYGKLDENNVLYITGRKKNLIILSNGKNVYPEEIENELAATPGVQDIIVYEGKSVRGIDHNAIVAEIYPDKDFLEANGISDAKAYFKPFVDEYNKNTVSYKKINILKVRDEEFPKNTLRKILRFKLDTTIE